MGAIHFRNMLAHIHTHTHTRIKTHTLRNINSKKTFTHTMPLPAVTHIHHSHTGDRKLSSSTCPHSNNGKEINNDIKPRHHY